MGRRLVYSSVTVGRNSKPYNYVNEATMNSTEKSLRHNKKYRISQNLDSWLDNLSKTGRGQKQALSVTIDAVLVLLSLWCAYSLRLGTFFDGFDATWHLFVLLPPLTILVMASLGIYRWVIRSSNRKLFGQLAKACLLSAFLLALTSFLVPAERANPRSLFVIYGLLLTCGTFSVRLLWQSLFDSERNGEPVAIYGAGEAGAQLLQTLHQGREYRPVLLLDDDPTLAGSTVSGLRVVKPDAETLQETLRKYDVGRVILAMPSVEAVEYESKVEIINHTGVPVQTIPTYAELVSGGAKLNQVRDISISDILGRSEVPPNVELLGKCVKCKVVLVTGAGGSIGSELCRQIVKQHPAKLVALDQSEENLYKLTEELRAMLSSENLVPDLFVPVLCSVNDSHALGELMNSHKLDTVYHAAAYKHVPIVEAQPEQGVRVNVFGTMCVLDTAIKNNVENFVLISTDKAVRPTNAMGATKRTAELVLQAKARVQNTTKISMVRFGNVLGSSGSVVPKFKKQIEQGGPITLTDPDITRFFMTIPEAAQLVLQASAIAKGGDVFVLDMGDPVRIEDLAISMIRMSGKGLKRETGSDSDIDIEISGLRPGEKMAEELFITDSHANTIIPKVFTANENSMRWEILSAKLEALAQLDSPGDRSAARRLLLELAFFGQPQNNKAAVSLDLLELAGNEAVAEERTVERSVV